MHSERGQTEKEIPAGPGFKHGKKRRLEAGGKGGIHCTGISSAVQYCTAEARARGEVTLQRGVVRDKALLVVRLEAVMRPGMRPGRSKAATGGGGRGKEDPGPLRTAAKMRRWPELGGGLCTLYGASVKYHFSVCSSGGWRRCGSCRGGVPTRPAPGLRGGSGRRSR